MLVVADVKKQVVAIEFTEVAVKGTSSGFGGPGNEWKVFDFVRLRMKGITSWSVDRSIRETAEHSKNPKCWRIDCRLMGGGKERQRTRLFLPQPIVNLVIFRLSGQKYQPPQQ